METISLPAGLGELLSRLLLATALGCIIGINRELNETPAGLRTHSLVALGSGLLTLIGVILALGTPPADSAALSRVMQGLLAGIGFIGGGVILQRSHDRASHALTTAASVWVAAAIGITTAVGKIAHSHAAPAPTSTPASRFPT